MSYYEPRLEYWRQLWRVLELADVAVMIVDARWVPWSVIDDTVGG